MWHCTLTLIPRHFLKLGTLVTLFYKSIVKRSGIVRLQGYRWLTAVQSHVFVPRHLRPNRSKISLITSISNIRLEASKYEPAVGGEILIAMVVTVMEVITVTAIVNSEYLFTSALK